MNASPKNTENTVFVGAAEEKSQQSSFGEGITSQNWAGSKVSSNCNTKPDLAASSDLVEEALERLAGSEAYAAFKQNEVGSPVSPLKLMKSAGNDEESDCHEAISEHHLSTPCESPLNTIASEAIHTQRGRDNTEVLAAADELSQKPNSQVEEVMPLYSSLRAPKTMEKAHDGDTVPQQHSHKGGVLVDLSFETGKNGQILQLDGLSIEEEAAELERYISERKAKYEKIRVKKLQVRR